MGDRKISLPPVFLSSRTTAEEDTDTRRGGDSSRVGLCSVQHYTGLETVNHCTNMSVAYYNLCACCSAL